MSTLTQSRLAKQLGVSRSTVAAVLNERSRNRFSDETRRRVLDAARQHGYRPDWHAQATRKGKSGLIGVVQCPTLLQTYHERLFHLAQAIHDAGFQVMSSDPLWFRGDVSALSNSMIEARVEGLIMTALTPEELRVVEAKQFRQAGIPLVSLSYKFSGYPLVQADVRQGMFDLTQHVMGLGHRRIALMLAWSPEQADENLYGSRLDRVRGFREAIEASGGRMIVASSQGDAPRSKGQELVGEILCEPVQPGLFAPNHAGFQAMKRLLKRSSLPQALVCGNDDWAVGAMNACLQAGLRVPQDLAITGFDNTSLGELCPSPLTSVAQPIEAVAKKAVDLLLRLIHGEKISAGEELVKLPCRVVVRESCGAQLPLRATGTEASKT